jgi:SAM-dependent methyltransferase
MHPEARSFLDYVVRTFPEYFKGVRVLDVGGGDINGNNRAYFPKESCSYEANDVVQARNVTVVGRTADLGFPDASFDVIVSSECFEHDMHYADSLKAIVRMLRPGGLFFFTCASTGRGEHGTRRSHPSCSFTLRLEGNDPWKDYYRNVTAKDVDDVLGLDATFENYAVFYNQSSHDLYFWGIKKGLPAAYDLPEPYSAPGVVQVHSRADPL